MSPRSGDDDVVRLSNPELDRRMRGLPPQSLNVIEGVNDSGKSIMAQQITYGALESKLRVLYITTESSVRGVFENMLSLRWDVTYPYLYGNLKITRFDTLHLDLEENSGFYLRALLSFIRQNVGFHLVIIDSLTSIITHAGVTDIMEFLSKCKDIAKIYGRTIVLTLHPNALNREIMRRMRLMSDGHLIMERRNFKERTVLTIKLMKTKEELSNLEGVISFEVSPTQGIKVIPIKTVER